MIKSTAHEFRVSTDERNSTIFGYFTNYSDGKTASHRQGWYGENGSSNKTVDILTFVEDDKTYSFLAKDLITVFHNEEQFKNAEVQRLREQALSKLSDTEKKALGLM
jgi:hypothetical protein